MCVYVLGPAVREEYTDQSIRATFTSITETEVRVGYLLP